MYNSNNMLVCLSFLFVLSTFLLQGSFAASTATTALDAKGSNVMKSCSTTSTNNDCPKNSACATAPNGSTDALCICMKGFTFYPTYGNLDEYCIKAQNSLTTTTEATTVGTSTTTVAPTSTSSTTISTTLAPKPVATSTLTTTMVASSTSTTTTTKAAGTMAPPVHTNDGVQSKPLIQPESHHFFAGIMLPLFVVFAFIGAVYAVRKYDLIERAQDYVHARTARHRTNYSNDFDEFDDPLLI